MIPPASRNISQPSNSLPVPVCQQSKVLVYTKNRERYILRSLLGIFASGIWLLTAAATDTEAGALTNGFVIYSFVAGVFMSCYVAIWLYVSYAWSVDLEKPFIKNYAEGNDLSYAQCLAVLILILNLAAAGVGTYNEPFKKPGNGYFSLWGGVVFSLTLTGVLFERDYMDATLIANAFVPIYSG